MFFCARGRELRSCPFVIGEEGKEREREMAASRGLATMENVAPLCAGAVAAYVIWSAIPTAMFVGAAMTAGAIVLLALGPTIPAAMFHHLHEQRRRR